MQLQVKGKQIDVGDSLRGYIDTALRNMTEKYFQNPLDASVVLSRSGHQIQSDISVHVGRKILLQSTGSANEAYAAFDQAAEKMDKRLRRHKRRLRDHHRDFAQKESLTAQSYVLEPEADEENSEPLSDQPVIIAEMTTEIEELTVSQAVMRMDLLDQSAFLFRNKGHGGLNMIYRRNDGNIGWVDPRLTS